MSHLHTPAPITRFHFALNNSTLQDSGTVFEVPFLRAEGPMKAKYFLVERFSSSSSLVNTPQKQRNTPVQFSSRKSVTFRTSLTGLRVLVA